MLILIPIGIYIYYFMIELLSTGSASDLSSSSHGTRTDNITIREEKCIMRRTETEGKGNKYWRINNKAKTCTNNNLPQQPIRQGFTKATTRHVFVFGKDFPAVHAQPLNKAVVVYNTNKRSGIICSKQPPSQHQCCC